MDIMNKNIFTVPEKDSSHMLITLLGKDRNNQKKRYVLSDRSTAFVGCPGSGKTTQLCKIVNQVGKNPHGITVILDIKKEYIYKCFQTGDVILSMHNLPEFPDENHVKWSLMKETWLDTYPEEVIREIAAMLFKNAIDHTENNAFPKAAMLVFYGQLVHYFRSCNGKLPFNSELIKKILTVSDSDIMDNVKKYADLFGVQNLLSKKTNITSFGVRMELKTVLLEAFPLGSNFCTDNSRFSIRQFMHEGKGHRLFIVFDTENRKTSEIMIKLLFDMALKESISGRNLEEGDMTRYYFVMDEYAYLPSGLEYLDYAKDMGRSKGVRIYGGFQTISQLIKLYEGKIESAMNDIAGYGDVVVFKPHDAATTEFTVNRGGTEITNITTIDTLCNVHTETREMPVVPIEVLNDLKCGEAVILPNEGRPFWFHFEQ